MAGNDIERQRILPRAIPDGLSGRGRRHPYAWPRGAEPEYPDPRLHMVRDALHLPSITPLEELQRVRTAVQAKRVAVTEGREEMLPEDALAGWLPVEYLTQFGDTPEARAHLLVAFKRFALWEYMDEYKLGDPRDEEGTIRALEDVIDPDLLAVSCLLAMGSSVSTSSSPRSQVQEGVGLRDVLRNRAEIELKRQLADYQRIDGFTDQETERVVVLASRFPQGTSIAIDDHATPTCTFPDGSVIQPVVGIRRRNDPYVIRYVNETGEESVIEFDRDGKSLPELNPVITQAFNILDFSHIYLWYFDRIRKKYGKKIESEEANVSVSVADRKVIGMKGDEGSVSEIRDFKNFLAKHYSIEQES